MIEIFDAIEQGSPEWFKLHAGIPTAGDFAKVLAKGKGGEESKTRTGYLWQKVDEALYGDVVIDSYTNANMERGKAWENDARSNYALDNDVVPQRVGFVKNHAVGAGCSPDALIDDDGELEIKTSFPRLWTPYLVKGGYPVEHKPQLQGNLWVTGRKWIDLVIYWPNRPLFVTRIERDEEYIAQLALQVRLFNAEVRNNVDAIRSSRNLRGQLEASREAAQ